MADLRSFSQLIEKEIAIHEHDVVPRYIPDLRDTLNACSVLMDVIYNQYDDFKLVGKAKSLKKSLPTLEKLMNFIHSDIKKNRRWSFWHFIAINIITSFAHEYLISKNKHSTIELDKQETWNSPNWEMATLFFYFIASSLYKDELNKFMSFQTQTGVDIDTLSRFLVRKINLVNGAA
ncbi:hypothetical protein [Alteromonas sp. 14N.309.X.WAT.G.H12]|uniref:hypothetical protein n=1 Tax=Alteromonas sp. 14N.309.X.WAT.G.H12 TaxID=3120824 RepID=UPI002FD01023